MCNKTKLKTFLALFAVFAVAGADAASTIAPRSLLGNRAGARRPNGNGNGNGAAPRANAGLTPSPAGGGDAGNASSSVIDDEAEKEKSSDLYFLEAPLDMVLDVYAKLVDRTVLKDPATPTATITVQSRPGQKLSKDEQVEALNVVLEMNGVHMENYGEKFVRALPREKARTEGIPFVEEDAELEESGKVVSTMIQFKNIPIDEAKTVLEGLKSAKGLLLVYERIGKILVTDTMLNINRMREVAKEIDVATPINENVYVRQIKNANATDIKTALEQIVQESQKELEKAGKAAQTAQNDRENRFMPGAMRPDGGRMLRRPGMERPGRENAQPAASANVESLVTSVSDADRGMIRGKVLIMADERSNKLIVVTAKTNMDFFDKVIEQLDVETTPDTVVKVYRLKYAEAEDVSDMINDLIGNASNKSGGKENQNAAAKSGSGGNLTRGNSPAPSTAANRQGANQRKGDAKAGELSKDNTTVLADKRINGLVVMTQKELVPTIESIIESMDIKLSQVLIETAIIEVTLGDDLRTGIDWVQRGRQHVWNKVQATDNIGRPLFYATDSDGKVTGIGFEGQTVEGGAVDTSLPVYKTVKSIVRDTFVNNGSYALGGGGGTGGLGEMFANATTGAVDVASGLFGKASPIGGGVNYLLKSDKLNIAAIIQASKTDTQAKYIASPIVMTVDNKEATIDATENRQFVTGWTAQSGSYGNSGQPTPNYSSKDIGIKLKITPKINPNGTVMLNVEDEYTQFVKDGQSMLIPQNGMYVNGNVDLAVERKMSADVLLEDRQTVVLGGLTETSVAESETGIPILKDIPWIGKWLFGSVTKTEARKELLIFLTPYVLDDAESAQAEAMRRKRALSDARPWDDHGWSASELADPISKKELMRRLKDEAKKQDEERQNRLAVEKWKLDRAKELEKMSEAERKFWIEQHKDELEKEQKQEFERELQEQEDLKAFAAELREKDMRKAEETIRLQNEAEKKAGEEAVNGRAGADEPALDAEETR